MANKNIRADAAKAIFEVLENGHSLRDIMPPILERHQGKDKGWIQEVVFGVLRQLPQLQSWLRLLLDKPLKGKQKIVEHLIIVGIYQLAFTRVSTHAAVAESVEACVTLKSHRLKGLVNAILRNFIRQGLASSKSDDPITRSGFPKWLYKKLADNYSAEQLASITEQSHLKAPLWLRINHREVTREKFLQALAAENLSFQEVDEQVDGVILTSPTEVTGLPGFADGWFTVQDGAAQLAADYLPLQKGQRILDACAAPGGKTTHLLQRTDNQIECTALDIEASRMQRTQENLVRLKLDAKLAIGDARQLKTWWDQIPYDCILLDAPCSATGVIRRHPDIKWLRQGSDIDNLVALQAEIIDQLWKTLAPGGTLLYATCSILKQENQQQIENFLARTDDAQLRPLNGDDQGMRQILPGEQQMDGFFYARLFKSTV